MLKIRLARGGAKKKPFYYIVAADSRSPRDGNFLDKLGTFDPKLPKDHEQRLRIDADKVKVWIGKGAQITDRVAYLLGKAGVIAAPAQKNNPEKAKPGVKMTDRAKERAEKAAAIAEAAKAPKEEAPAAEAEAPAAAEETAS